MGRDLLVPTETLATEAIGVRARTAVVGVGNLALGRGPARRLAVAAIAAPFAHDQALKQVTATARPVAAALPGLLALGLNRLEESFAHQRRDINEDLIVPRSLDRCDRAPGRLGSAPLGPEAPGLVLACACLAESRLPSVGGVLEDQPDRRPVPGRFAGPRGDTFAPEASAD